MLEVDDQTFEELVNEAINAVPEKYYKRINNVAFVVADEPTEEQRHKLNLACNQTLFGLYEGIPLTKRGVGYNLVLPDVITIFKLPMLQNCKDYIELNNTIHKTVWHEVAHYFGLGHEQIHKLGG